MTPTPDPDRTANLIERATRAVISASLRRPLAADDLAVAERSWRPVRTEYVARQRRAGREGGTEHGHWSWERTGKIDAVARGQTIVVGIELAGEWQGLMAVAAVPRPSRSWPAVIARWFRRPVLYVDYLESAPWNNPDLTRPDPPRFGGVGTRLLIEAVRMSRERGLGGRLGLHSLPQAVPFYLGRGMRLRLRTDAGYEDLAYLEYTERGAAGLLARHDGSRS